MQLDRFITRDGILYRIDADGNIFQWVNYPGHSGLGDLDGFFKKIGKAISRPIKKAVKTATKVRKKVFKTVTKSKFGRQLIRVGGVAFAPFTGGLSLAAAEAAARYGKARYVQGASRGQAFRRGAVGAAIGAATGYGISRAYGAFARPAASGAFAPVGAAPATPGGFSYAGYTAPAGVTAAAPGVSFFPSVGNVMTTLGRGASAVIKGAGALLPVLSATGVLAPKGTEQAPSGEFYDAGAAAPAPFEGQYGGGGGGRAPGGFMQPDEAGEGEAAPPINIPMLAGVAAAGLLLFTTMGKRRGR